MATQIPDHRLVRVIHHNGSRVIHEAVDGQGQVVAIKTLSAQYPDKTEVAELSREYDILSRLGAISGVIQPHRLVSHGAGNVAIVMDLHGRSLADVLRERQGAPLSLGTFLPLAIALVRLLGQVHDAGIVHKDLVPRNLLVDGNEIRLIDFGIASELSRELQVSIPTRLHGSLPYLSPEQTGRMNRDVDHRSDYYSLGATFYELLTGTLPFHAETVLGWVYAHISVLPDPPSTRDPAVPEGLSRIVMKLLSKNAEDRYQSTFGLVADLEQAALAHARLGDIPPFELGRSDVSSRFQIPQHLYGRQTELATLRGLFDTIAAGGNELCMVTGWSGVGKSALVAELGQSIVGGRGFLIQGKFDQFQRNTPYSAISTAFDGLARQLLSEPEEALAARRAELLAALGPNARVLTDLVPELETVLGQLDPVAQLPSTEAQNRLMLTVLEFLRVFTRDEPLVLFLDDLQWSDGPTLTLLGSLSNARNLGSLMVIGAYRSNQVGPGHPLHLVLEEIRQQRTLTELRLEPLGRSAVGRLVADTLRQSPTATQRIADLVFDKARGNPFFVTELLKGLHEAGHLDFDSQTGTWGWDAEAVAAAEVSEDVVEFMAVSLRRLPKDTQRALELAACIGSRFDLGTLALIMGSTHATASERIRPALKRNLIAPLSDAYRHAGASATDAWYRFQHDRIQQAAKALIAPDRRAAVHLSIGTRLLEQGHGVGARLMETVGHLNEGMSLVTDVGHRVRLSELNRDAAVRARSASAYRAAHDFATLGLSLLPEDAETSHRDLMRALGTELQQSAYLTGATHEAEQWSERLLMLAGDALSRAQVLATRTRQYATLGRMDESIHAAIQGLSELGLEFPDEPTAADVQAQLAAVRRRMEGRDVGSLLDEPPVSDPRHRLALALLMEIFPAAFLSGSGHLFPYLVLESVNLSLEHGSGPESAFSYAAYGMLLCGSLGDPALGLAFGRLGVDMVERFDEIALKSRVIYVYAMFCHHWSNPWATMTPWFERGIETGRQSGDLLYLAYSAQDCTIWDPTLDLDVASAKVGALLEIVADTGYRDSFDSGSLFHQMQLNFMGQTTGRFSMDTDDFNEAAVVEGMVERSFMTGVCNHHIYKAEIHWLYEDVDGAAAQIRAVEPLIASAMSLPQLVRFEIIAFLTRAAGYIGDAEGLAQLTGGRDRMAGWAEHCAENFAHLVALMDAELHRLAERVSEATDAYENAIRLARVSGFRRDEAMAHELAGRAFLERGLHRAAEGYLRAAHYLYYRWGAVEKVRQMEERHSVLVLPVTTTAYPTLSPSRTTSTSKNLSPDVLDLESVFKASQQISGVLVLDQLWRVTLEVLIENAHAQSGCFLVRVPGGLRVQTVVGFDLVPGRVLTDREADAPLPISLLRTVLRTNRPVVVDDAVESTRFGSDPYIRRTGPRSVLAVPIARGDRFAGVIYLENNLAPSVFTESRINVIELLAAQAAISTENAQLYQEQTELVEAQRRFVPDQFLENLGHLDIGTVTVGESVSREMSVLFSDLRGFTPLAERLGPRRMIDLLNRHFREQEAPIAAAGGFIDSFNGDEIMALFGGEPTQAVTAGIGMWRALEAFNADADARGEATLRMGVGLNTGPLVLGTVGGTDRLKCGVVGDTVNLASRIEQLTKHYDLRFLIGHATRVAVPDGRFSLRQIDTVAVKGKRRSVVLYEVLDAETDENRASREATRELLHGAHERYASGDFAEALELLRGARSVDPNDPVLPTLASRCERFLETPPDAGWSGIHTFTHK